MRNLAQRCKHVQDYLAYKFQRGVWNISINLQSSCHTFTFKKFNSDIKTRYRTEIWVTNRAEGRFERKRWSLRIVADWAEGASGKGKIKVTRKKKVRLLKRWEIRG